MKLRILSNDGGQKRRPENTLEKVIKLDNETAKL